MKKNISLALVALLLLTTGCGKKKEKKKEQTMAYLELDERALHSTLDLADAAGFDADFEEFEREELAFLENEFDLDLYDEELMLSEAEEEEDKDLEWENIEDTQFSFKTINYAFNQEDIDQEEERTLEENIEVAFQAIAQGNTVVVEGHAGLIGSEYANLKISMSRAEKVREKMIERGLDGASIEAIGYGNEMPVVVSESEDREEQIEENDENRRVSFSVI